MSAAAAASGSTGVVFPRRSSRGVILGLSAGQVFCFGCAGMLVAAAVYAGGFPAVLVAAPLWGALVVLALARVAGVPIVQWAPVCVQYAGRRAMGQLEFRREQGVRRPEKVLALPGDVASLRLHRDEHETGMVIDPHGRTMTAVLRLRHPAFVLLDVDDQRQRAMAWAQALAGYCNAGSYISRIQTLERTLPDSSNDARAYWDRAGVHDGSWASRSYQQLMATAAPDALRHESLMAVTLDMRAAKRAGSGQGRGLAGLAALLRAQMASIERTMQNARLRPVGWLGPDEVTSVLRTAYDPTVTGAYDRHPGVGRSPGSAGPMAVRERWGHLQADGVYHCVLIVTEWPRVEVEAGFLWPVVLTAGVQRTFTLLMEPQITAKALKEAQAERLKYDTDRKAREKADLQVGVADEVEAAEVHQREAELTAGHGSMNYVGLLAVSAPTRKELDRRVSEVVDTAAQSAVRLDRLYGRQGQGFVAAALPLGQGL
ncbi:MAG: PrgI family protein [Aeromicrobium sp.]|uniref:SCO6880 family protein n=1 Tax=Aeromicrobium sp. TaxID=1871063 RepID=UPI0039E597D2